MASEAVEPPSSPQQKEGLEVDPTKTATTAASPCNSASSADLKEDNSGKFSLEQHVWETMSVLAARVTAASEPADPEQANKIRPPLSYARLAALAIVALSGRAKVTDIYDWIEEHYPYYRSGTTWWKNCIRHNLSIKKFFQRNGPFWHHIADLDDMSDIKTTKAAKKGKEKKSKDKDKSSTTTTRASLSSQDPAYFNQWGMPPYHVGYQMPSGYGPSTMPGMMAPQPYMMQYPGHRHAQSQQPSQQQRQQLMQQMMLQRMMQLKQPDGSSSSKRRADDSLPGAPPKIAKMSNRTPQMVDAVQAQMQQQHHQHQQLQMQQMMMAYMNQQQQSGRHPHPQMQYAVPPQYASPAMMMSMYGAQQQFMVPSQFGQAEASTVTTGSDSKSSSS